MARSSRALSTLLPVRASFMQSERLVLPDIWSVKILRNALNNGIETEGELSSSKSVHPSGSVAFYMTISRLRGVWTRWRYITISPEKL